MRGEVSTVRWSGEQTFCNPLGAGWSPAWVPTVLGAAAPHRPLPPPAGEHLLWSEEAGPLLSPLESPPVAWARGPGGAGQITECGSALPWSWFPPEPCSNYFLLFCSPNPGPCRRVPRRPAPPAKEGKVQGKLPTGGLDLWGRPARQAPNLLTEDGRAARPAGNVPPVLGRGSHGSGAGEGGSPASPASATPLPAATSVSPLNHWHTLIPNWQAAGGGGGGGVGRRRVGAQ